MNTLHALKTLVLHDPLSQLMCLFIVAALFSITVNIIKRLKKKKECIS